MKELEKAVRQVTTEGLLWGACKLFLFLKLINYLIDLSFNIKSILLKFH